MTLRCFKSMILSIIAQNRFAGLIGAFHIIIFRGDLNTWGKGAWPMGISFMGHAPSPWGNGPATSDSCVDLIKECKYTGSVMLSKHCSVCLRHPKMSYIPGDSYHPFSCMAVTRLTYATLELRNMLSSVLHTTYSL